jgi:hypothetical protein
VLAVGAEQVEVGLDDRDEQPRQVETGLGDGPEGGCVGPDRLGVQGGEQLLLGGEVGVERGRAHPGAGSQVAHVEGQVAAFGDPLAGGVEDVDAPLLAVAPLGRRAAGGTAATTHGANSNSV